MESNQNLTETISSINFNAPRPPGNDDSLSSGRKVPCDIHDDIYPTSKDSKKFCTLCFGLGVRRWLSENVGPTGQRKPGGKSAIAHTSGKGETFSEQSELDGFNFAGKNFTQDFLDKNELSASPNLAAFSKFSVESPPFGIVRGNKVTNESKPREREFVHASRFNFQVCEPMHGETCKAPPLPQTCKYPAKLVTQSTVFSQRYAKQTPDIWKLKWTD